MVNCFLHPDRQWEALHWPSARNFFFASTYVCVFVHSCVRCVVQSADHMQVYVMQIANSSFTVNTQTCLDCLPKRYIRSSWDALSWWFDQKWGKTKSNHVTASEHKPDTWQARYDCHAQERPLAKRKECISTILDPTFLARNSVKWLRDARHIIQ